MTLDDKPRVSIITPTFNRADFIEQAVNSVLKQSYPNFELFIVDDGSTDDTKKRLDSALEDPRVHYFYQPNQGQSVTRNLALSYANGDLICFLDSDNYWPENKLENQVTLLDEQLEVDVVYGDIITVDEHDREISRKNMKRYSGNIARYMIRDNCVSMNTAMARRRCFDELGATSGTRRVADDYDLWLRFSARFRFIYIPEISAYYRHIATDEDVGVIDLEESLPEGARWFSDHQHFTDAGADSVAAVMAEAILINCGLRC